MTTKEITKSTLREKFTVIRESSNDVTGSPIWNSRKRYLSQYLKGSKITEMSAKELSSITGINSKLALVMLIELNSELFNKRLSN